MNVNLNPNALARIRQLGKQDCCLQIKRGGCFGNTASFSFDIPLDAKDYKDIEGVTVYIVGELDDDIIIDYHESLVKSGFVIKAATQSNCCCNKSFGKRVNKANCITG